jgi:stage IV sporulation protein FB
MHDPFAWSIPFGRLFGITIRIHVLFPFIFVALVAKAAFEKDAVPYVWVDQLVVLTILFFSVLLHEFGHCFGARLVKGDAHEVLLWPLGGLANVDVPHTPRAHFLTALAGPLVNVGLAVGAALFLLLMTPPIQPHWDPTTFLARNTVGDVPLINWSLERVYDKPFSLPVLLSHLFWVNYLLFLFNMVLIGFPMDAGRMFQSVAWKYVGYRRATLAAIYMGFFTMFAVGLYAIISTNLLMFGLALFIYVSCKQQWLLLEGGGEESLFGYDFSQGYTSLERGEEPAPAPPPPKQSWWQRWMQRRAEKRQQREQEQREAEERRLDELLEKVQRHGVGSLTDEERRFMQRVSDRYRNRRTS